MLILNIDEGKPARGARERRSGGGGGGMLGGGKKKKTPPPPPHLAQGLDSPLIQNSLRLFHFVL